MIRIECYRATDGSLANVMVKDLYEYTAWVARATNRKFEFVKRESDIYVFDPENKEKRAFVVKEGESA